MRFLKKMIDYLELNLAREVAKPISFWSSESYSTFFDRKDEGFWVINYQKVALLLPSHLIGATEDAEHAICTELETYKQLGFWDKLWWQLTKPMAIYQHLHTQIMLQNLIKAYQNIQSASNKKAFLLNPDLSYLEVYFTANLLSHDFMNYFQKTDLLSARIFQKHLKECKNIIESKYEAYLMKILMNQTDSSYLKHIAEKIGVWIEDSNIALEQLYNIHEKALEGLDYEDLRESLRGKLLVLEKLILKNIPLIERPRLLTKDKKSVEDVFEALIYSNTSDKSTLQENFITLAPLEQEKILQKEAKNLIFTYNLALEKKITRPYISLGDIHKYLNQFLVYSDYVLFSATHCLANKKAYEDLLETANTEIKKDKCAAIGIIFQFPSPRLKKLFDEIKRGELTTTFYSLESCAKKLDSIGQRRFFPWLSQQQRETESWYETFMKLPYYEPTYWESLFQADFKSPWEEEISKSFKLFESRATLLSKEAFLKEVDEKAVELLYRFMEEQPLSIKDLHFAFTEITNCYQTCYRLKCKDYKQLPKVSNQTGLPSQTKSALPPAKDPITLPKRDTDTAWLSWFAEILKTPRLIPQALDKLANQLKQPGPTWQTTFLRYTILTKLALHYVTGVKWNLIPEELYLAQVVNKVQATLKATYHSLALYYHPDKPTGNTEAMQKLNDSNVSSLNEIEKAVKDALRPEWISNLVSHQSSHRTKHEDFIGQELDKLQKHQALFEKFLQEQAEKNGKEAERVKTYAEKIQMYAEENRKDAEKIQILAERLQEQEKMQREQHKKIAELQKGVKELMAQMSSMGFSQPQSPPTFSIIDDNRNNFFGQNASHPYSRSNDNNSHQDDSCIERIHVHFEKNNLNDLTPL